MLVTLLVLVSCTTITEGHKDRPAVTHPETLSAAAALSPAQDYAGEILAYFLQITVGHIGPEKSKQAWRSTGRGADLDFRSISNIMSQPELSKTDVLVMDFDLLSLVEVLSHYNPQFNQFKGKAIFDSVYPSSELIAIRLLINRKLDQGQQVDFTAMQQKEFLLHPHSPPPSPADLQVMNLTAAEFQLIKDVFASDPLLFQYYKHPFIVDALTRIGFYRKDRLTEQIGRSASYLPYAPRHRNENRARNSVSVAVLPSFTPEFEFGGSYEKPYIYGFKPSAGYTRAVNKLKETILSRTARLLLVELRKMGQKDATDTKQWEKMWRQTYAPLVDFQLFDRRPLTIYPENADQMVTELYPKADLVILLLGEGIRRAIDAKNTAEKSTEPRLIYFDMDDIRYFKRNETIDKIAGGIVDRLVKNL